MLSAFFVTNSSVCTHFKLKLVCLELEKTCDFVRYQYVYYTYQASEKQKKNFRVMYSKLSHQITWMRNLRKDTQTCSNLSWCGNAFETVRIGLRIVCDHKISLSAFKHIAFTIAPYIDCGSPHPNAIGRSRFDSFSWYSGLHRRFPKQLTCRQLFSSINTLSKGIFHTLPTDRSPVKH